MNHDKNFYIEKHMQRITTNEFRVFNVFNVFNAFNASDQINDKQMIR